MKKRRIYKCNCIFCENYEENHIRFGTYKKSHLYKLVLTSSMGGLYSHFAEYKWGIKMGEYDFFIIEKRGRKWIRKVKETERLRKESEEWAEKVRERL